MSTTTISPTVQRAEWSNAGNVRSALLAFLLVVTTISANAQTYYAYNNTAVSWDNAVTYNNGSSFTTWTVAANSNITITAANIVSVRVRCAGTTCDIAADACTGRVLVAPPNACGCFGNLYEVRFDHCIDPWCSAGSCNTGSNRVTIR
jgi:hypothetical protein